MLYAKLNGLLRLVGCAAAVLEDVADPGGTLSFDECVDAVSQIRGL